jgi:hypothetical protein
MLGLRRLACHTSCDLLRHSYWHAKSAGLTHPGMRMDKVTQDVMNLKKGWDQTVKQVEQCIAAFESCEKTGIGTEEAHSLPMLNRDAKDGTQMLKTLQFRFDFMAQQLPTF